MHPLKSSCEKLIKSFTVHVFHSQPRQSNSVENLKSKTSHHMNLLKVPLLVTGSLMNLLQFRSWLNVSLFLSRLHIKKTSPSVVKENSNNLLSYRMILFFPLVLFSFQYFTLLRQWVVLSHEVLVFYKRNLVTGECERRKKFHLNSLPNETKKLFTHRTFHSELESRR